MDILLTILFIGLKLANIIMWSWWWVLAPLWGSFLLGFVLRFIILSCDKYLAKHGKDSYYDY